MATKKKEQGILDRVLHGKDESAPEVEDSVENAEESTADASPGESTGGYEDPNHPKFAKFK